MRALVVRRLGVRALVAGLAAAGVVWSGGCVSTTGCPPSVAIDSLDPSIRSALTLDDAWGRAVGAELDYAGTQRYDFERGRPVRTSLRWAGEAGPVVLPMVRRSNVWGVRVLAVGLDGVERPVTVRIDTGHAGQLAIDGDTARDIGAPTLAGVSPGMHYTAFGPKASQLGVLAGLRLGDATLAPVGPEIECDGPAFEPLLGVDLLDRFGHAVFDWAGRRLILLPRGADVAGAAGDTRWVALPWRAGARVRTDAGVRTVVNDDRRATLVDIDGV